MSTIEKEIRYKEGRKTIKIPLIIYSTPTELVDNLTETQLRDTDYLKGHGRNGEEWVITKRKLISNIKKFKSWGFTSRNPKELHIWFDKCISFIDMLSFISHECVHLIGPQFKTSKAEERRACHYEAIGPMAYSITKEIFKQETNRSMVI